MDDHTHSWSSSGYSLALATREFNSRRRGQYRLPSSGAQTIVSINPGRLSLLPYAEREMSTGQSAAMLCRMVHSTCGQTCWWQVKLCDSCAPLWGELGPHPTQCGWPGLRPTYVPSFILIHPTVIGHNIHQRYRQDRLGQTDKTDRQTNGRPIKPCDMPVRRTSSRFIPPFH